MKKIRFALLVFGLVGCAMIGFSIYNFYQTRVFLSTAVRAQGVVTGFQHNHSNSSDGGSSVTYAPIVQFVAASGQPVRFTSQTGSNPPQYSKGETIEVFYDPVPPHKAKINDFFSLWFSTALLFGMGLVFFGIGPGMVLFRFMKRRRAKRLKERGVAIDAAFQRLAQNTAYSINEVHPYNIYAAWKDPMTGKSHVFKSDNIWFDPAPYIGEIKTLKVFIERHRPESYHVDLSFLPEQ